MIDYALWEVIENGVTLPKTKIVEGVMTEMPITNSEQSSDKIKRNLLEAVKRDLVGRMHYKKEDSKESLKAQQYENITTTKLPEMLDQKRLIASKACDQSERFVG
ncbi:hypothetical protein Tco_0818774 [Tanacetum coccineum]